MTEEVVAPVAAPVEVAPAPAVEAPIEAAPAVVEAAPVAEPAPEAAPLLAPVEEAPVESEAPKAEEAPKVEEAPAELPVYEFKLPEGTKTDSEAFKSFQSKLGEFQNQSKLQGESVQKLGQDMIDLHLEGIKTIVEEQNKASWDWFKARNTEWLEKAKSDPVIGGDNWDTTVRDAQTAMSLYGGNKAQQLETAKLLQETGVENHPAILRFLSNITKTAAKEGQPVSSQSVPVQKQGIASAMYGGTK